jgi:hypothetical protein
MTVIVYEVLEQSRNDPDNGPKLPPAKGMWVWWRTGPHPQGVWQAMDLTGGTDDGRDATAAWRKNWDDHPIAQDQAFGESGDFGNFCCHACGYLSDGYPEPNHRTSCDGICKRDHCTRHGLSGQRKAIADVLHAVDWATSRGVSVEAVIDEIRHHYGPVSQPAEEPDSSPGQ